MKNPQRTAKGSDKTARGQSKWTAKNIVDRQMDLLPDKEGEDEPPTYRESKKRNSSMLDDNPRATALVDSGFDFRSITDREDMILHPMREKFLSSRKRFDVVPAGRRSGKTVEARTRLIWGTRHIGGIHYGCLNPPPGVDDPTFIYAAPTYSQAKRIMWDKVKAESPKWAIEKILENELTIYFKTGARLMVVGMDKPERVEGIAIDGVVLDEFADMKPQAWTSSIRPALSTIGRPEGWALFIGRPRGKNHFWKLFKAAKKRVNMKNWGVYYPWPSWAVMKPEEVAQARMELDPRAFRQEYGGEFVDDGSVAYYQFGEYNKREVVYNPANDLLICLDFNTSPGVATFAQDYEEVIDLPNCPRCMHPGPGFSGQNCSICGFLLPHETISAFIGEIYVKEDSNTRVICERIVKEWGHKHRGHVICYGDASGGARRTSSERSDWQLVEDYLSKAWPTMEIDIPKANPLQRDRMVVANARLMNASGVSRVIINEEECSNLVDDFQSTQLTDRGELDEGPDKLWTHMTDAATYMLWRRFGSPIHSPNSAEFEPI